MDVDLDMAFLPAGKIYPLHFRFVNVWEQINNTSSPIYGKGTLKSYVFVVIRVHNDLPGLDFPFR